MIAPIVWQTMLAAFIGLLIGVVLSSLQKKPARTLEALERKPLPIPPRSSLSNPGDDRWAEVIDVLDDAVCMIDRDGNVLRANRAFGARVGATDGNVRGINLAPLLDPKSLSTFAADGPIALALRTQRPASGTIGPCRFGTQAQLWAMPIVSRTDAIAVAIRDLTGARDAEDRVRHLGRLVGQLPIVVVEADPVTNKLTFANTAFAECFGASSEDAALGLSIDELTAKKSGEQIRALAFAGGGATNVELAKHDGSVFPARVHSRLIRKNSGAPETLVLMIEDITRERETVRQRELLAAAVEASKDGIVITDLKGVITYANAAAGALYGRDLVGIDLRSLHRGHPKEIDVDRGWTGDLARAAGGEALRPTRVTVAAVRQIEGQNAAAYVAILHDITDEREMQEQVLRSQKLATLGEVAATLNHEISNPLTFLLANSAHVLDTLERMDGNADQELKNAAKEALDGAERIQAIVSEVRRFAHMGKGGRMPVTFQSALESALAIVGRRVRSHAEIERLSGPPIEVFVDPGHLTQVVLNLVVNAAQALEDAQRKGTIRFEQGVEPDGSYAWLRVIDDGPGIPEAVRDRLFKDYVTTKEPGRGTGFGLRISQKLVEANNGEIRVDSTGEAGTTFTIRLPRSAMRATEPTDSGNFPIPPQKTDPSWSAFEKRLQAVLTGDLPRKPPNARTS